jgi:hypothetical protein
LASNLCATILITPIIHEFVNNRFINSLFAPASAINSSMTDTTPQTEAFINDLQVVHTLVWMGQRILHADELSGCFHIVLKYEQAILKRG